ncbi:response regulator [Roseospira visakhapatnamensis]|uniref:DNA-binding response OmpR family regulator n=1 Tax=Roseospira visakhapatnamensis TaxID=390880 RepID=A0A7W6RAC6_9PROT|nr:DNA-binding response OmpR family regulator [Roseospira visakhapatnamensis]
MPTRLLIAEDEPSILESLVFILAREGYDIATARDGEDALDRLRDPKGPPGLLILDVMLPRLDGFEVLRRVRDDPALKRVPVLMLTAKGQARDRQMAEQMGADAFIAKPFSNQDVVRQARRLAAP